MMDMDMEKREDNIGALREEYTGCVKCTLSNPCGRSRNNVVHGKGNLGAAIMIIGESPGFREDEKGDILSGHTGGLLSDLFKEFSIPLEDVYFTNLVLCRATNAKNKSKSRLPDKKELKACRERLDREIEIIDPQILILLGEKVYKEMTGGKHSITRLMNRRESSMVNTRGKFLSIQRPGMVLHHPEYLFHNMIMEAGSPIHRTLLALQKAISIADTAQNLYWGTEFPDRGEPFEES